MFWKEDYMDIRIRDRLREIKEKLAKYDILLGKEMGYGTRGIVYELVNEPNKVLKITNDESEALSSNIIKKHPCKNIAHYDRVFKFKDEPRTFKPHLWFIIMEKLKPLNESERSFFYYKISDILKLIDQDEIIKNSKTIQDLAKAGYDLGSEMRNVIYYKFDPRYDSPEEELGSVGVAEIQHLMKKIAEANIKYISKMTKAFLNAKDHLKKVNIEFDDLIPANVMKRGDDYVLIDLGYSRSPQTKIDVLEQIKRIVKEEVKLEKNKQLPENIILYHATRKPLKIKREGIKKSEAGVIKKEGIKYVYVSNTPIGAFEALKYEEDLKEKMNLPIRKSGDIFIIKISVPKKDITIKPNNDVVIARDIKPEEIIELISSKNIKAENLILVKNIVKEELKESYV